MRTAIYDYIDTLTLGSFSLTNELPWSSTGTPLYIKNPKRIYVDRPQTVLDKFIHTLDDLSLNQETTVVKVYFTTDAKVLPSNYETLLRDIKAARLSTDIEGVSRRECDVATNFEADLMVTELTFRFTQLT
jgi:hypothetical protein